MMLKFHRAPEMVDRSSFRTTKGNCKSIIINRKLNHVTIKEGERLIAENPKTESPLRIILKSSYDALHLRSNDKLIIVLGYGSTFFPIIRLIC